MIRDKPTGMVGHQTSRLGYISRHISKQIWDNYKTIEGIPCEAKFTTKKNFYKLKQYNTFLDNSTQ